MIQYYYILIYGGFERIIMKALYQIATYYLAAGDSHIFRTGNRYQILLVTQGACRFRRESKWQPCHSTDMILLKPGQTQTVETLTQNVSCTLLCVRVSTESLAQLSDPTCSLTEKFDFAPYRISVVHAEINSFMQLRNIIAKLDTLRNENIALGLELYEKSLFTTFLILFLRTCVQGDQTYQAHQKKILVIDDVFQYISRHLTEDLSLKVLEDAFFISGEHLSREFKKRTGIPLHAYITRSRLDLSKKYLLQGIAVRDVCQLCGFGSYNHFFKAFKKEYGMTPRAYYQKMCDS